MSQVIVQKLNGDRLNLDVGFILWSMAKVSIQLNTTTRRNGKTENALLRRKSVSSRQIKDRENIQVGQVGVKWSRQEWTIIGYAKWTWERILGGSMELPSYHLWYKLITMLKHCWLSSSPTLSDSQLCEQLTVFSQTINVRVLTTKPPAQSSSAHHIGKPWGRLEEMQIYFHLFQF